MAPSVEPFNLGLRKPKSLEFTAKISKVSDLKPYMLASLLGRAHQCITEQSVMCIGGELYELRKRAVVVALGRLQTNTWLHSYVEHLG